MRSSIGILCGGKSRRMGQDKASLLWDGKTMLEHLAEELGRTGREVLVSVASPEQFICDANVRMVPDLFADCGPLGGIYSVMKAATADTVFFCAVDMPFVTEKAVEYLEQFLSGDYDGVIFTDGERVHPLCGIYKKTLLPVVEEQLVKGDYRVRRLPELSRIRQVSIASSELPEKTLWNTNTPEDFSRAVRSLHEE